MPKLPVPTLGPATSTISRNRGMTGIRLPVT